MPPHLALFGGIIVAVWLVRSDMQWRTAGSKLLLFAALFLGIIGSRPLSYWLGSSGGNSDGNPINTAFFAALMVISLLGLQARALSWGHLIERNKALFLLYAFFAISALWSIDLSVSFKRVLKDFSCVLLALLILSEDNPAHACRTIFVRVSYVLFPLSLVFGKYFPDIGRSYSIGGAQMFTGVTTQKNSLGEIVMVFGFMLLWDLLELHRNGGWHIQKRRRRINMAVLALGLWLLFVCDSKTSLICLLLGAAVLLLRTRFLRMSHPKGALFATMLASGAMVGLDSVFGVSEAVLSTLNRDSTLTGRTDIWREVLRQQTDPWVGGGFYIFWDSDKGKAVADELVTLNSAHSGYIETYLDGGILGCFVLAILVLTLGIRAFNRFFEGGEFSPIGLPIWVSAVIYNFSESSFMRLDPLWFTLILVSMEMPARLSQWAPAIRLPLMRQHAPPHSMSI